MEDSNSILPFTDSDVFRALRRSPAVIQAENEKTQRQHRLEIGAELVRVRERRERELADLENLVKHAGSRLAEVIPVYNDRVAEVQASQLAYQTASAAFDGKIARLGAVLVATSSPLIDEFIAALRALHDNTRRVESSTTEINRKTAPDGTIAVKLRTDRPSIDARLAEIVRAMRLVETWRLDADQNDIVRRFESLIADLPHGPGHFVEIVVR